MRLGVAGLWVVGLWVAGLWVAGLWVAWGADGCAPFDRWKREGEAGTQPRSFALGPDASSVSLHNSLAHRQSKAGVASVVLGFDLGEFPEKDRHAVGGDASAVVGH